MPYTTSSFIGDVGRTPDEELPVDANLIEEWARKKNRLKDRTVKGSTIFQDPSQPADPKSGFLGSFIGRPTDDPATQDMIKADTINSRNSFGAEGSVPVTNTVSPNVLLSTKDRTVKPRLTAKVIESFRPEFEADRAKSEKLAEMERLIQIQEDMADRKAAREDRYAEKDFSRRRGAAKEDFAMAQSSPTARAAQTATDLQLSSLRRQDNSASADEAERYKARQIKANVAPYKATSQPGQLAYQNTLEQTNDIQAANLAARKADQEAEDAGFEVERQSFLSNATDFNKQDTRMFGADPSDADSEQLLAQANSLVEALVKRGMPRSTARAKIKLLLKEGLPNTSALNAGKSQNLYRSFDRSTP
jgi:hypothetical protein